MSKYHLCGITISQIGRTVVCTTHKKIIKEVYNHVKVRLPSLISGLCITCNDQGEKKLLYSTSVRKHSISKGLLRVLLFQLYHFNRNLICLLVIYLNKDVLSPSLLLLPFLSFFSLPPSKPFPFLIPNNSIL